MWHPIARPPNKISKCSYLMRFFVGIGIIIPFIIPQWSVGGGGWWSMLVLDPQATLLFQTTDFTLHSSARMSSQRLELKRRPKPKSWRKLANGISMGFHPFIPDIQARGQHESLPSLPHSWPERPMSCDQGNEMHNFGILPWNVPLHCCNSPWRSQSELWDDRWFSPTSMFFKSYHWPGESKPGHLLVEVSGLKMFL